MTIKCIKTNLALSYIQDSILSGDGITILGFGVSSSVGEFSPDRTLNTIGSEWYTSSTFISSEATDNDIKLRLQVPEGLLGSNLFIGEIYIRAVYHNTEFLFAIAQVQDTLNNPVPYIAQCVYNYNLDFNLGVDATSIPFIVYNQYPWRSIGEIVTSTIPLADAGLHLLDGALIQGNGIYRKFVNYIANLYNDSEITPEWNKNTLINLPTFSSNTQDGITISDSRDNTTVLQAIFNGTNSYNSIGLWSTYWININYNQATIIGSYTIQADSNGVTEYPSAWTLQASNDGTNWDILDTQTGVTFSLNQSKTFSVTTHTRYEQYRLVFSNGVESSNNGELKKVTFNVYTPIQTIENTYFATESQWQQSVTDYGVCGKFVYDSINNTVRLPKITGFTEGTIDPTELGDLTEAGLPNINGTLIAREIATGAFRVESTNNVVGGGSYQQGNLSFDASRSSSIYGNSVTVQPQSIKVLYYIVIATSTKTDIEVDIDEIATDLNGKADVDLVNVNNSGTSLGASWALPSSTYIDLTLGASGAEYVAPANGWVTLVGYNGSAGSTTLRNTTSSVVFIEGSPSSAYYAELSVPCVKNDIIQVSWHNGSLTIPSDGYFKFVYAKGSESEIS